MNKKIVISCLILLSSTFFVACKESNISALQKQSNKEITNIQNLISNSYNPSNEDILISAFESKAENINSEDDTFMNWKVIFSPSSYETNSNFSMPKFPFEYTNIIATYIPRYLENSSETSGFNKFINKLENLYLQMQDALIVNSKNIETNKSFQVQLNLIKEKINTLQNKKIEISNETFANAKEIINEISNISNDMKIINKEIQTEILEIKNEKNNLLLNTDSLSNKYIKIINSLDKKSSYLNNLQQCINQLDVILIEEFYTLSTTNQSTNHYIESQHLKPISKDSLTKNNINILAKSDNSVKKKLPYIMDNNKSDKTILPL